MQPILERALRSRPSLQVKAAGKMMMRNVSTRIVNIATALTAPSSVRWCIPRFGRERASGGRMGDRELRVVGKVARARAGCTAPYGTGNYGFLEGGKFQSFKIFNFV